MTIIDVLGVYGVLGGIVYVLALIGLKERPNTPYLIMAIITICFWPVILYRVRNKKESKNG